MTTQPLCPECGQPVAWDTTADPHAWRHTGHDSRWCELPPDTNQTEPTYPRGATDPNRVNPTRGTTPTPMLTVKEVAAFLRVSKMTVYRMIEGGDLPALRIGRSYRLRVEDMHDYLREAATTPKEPQP